MKEIKRTAKRQSMSGGLTVMEDVGRIQETRHGQRPARMVGYTSLDLIALCGMKPRGQHSYKRLQGGRGSDETDFKL